MNAPSGIEQQFLLRASSTWRVFSEKRNTAMEGNFQGTNTAPHHRPLAMTAAGIGRLPGAYFFTVRRGNEPLRWTASTHRPSACFAPLQSPIWTKRPALWIIPAKNVSRKKFKNQAGNAATTIAIAHRLSALRNCDGIIVMDRGLTVQRGAFKTLERFSGIRPWHWKMGPNTRFFCQRPFY